MRQLLIPEQKSNYYLEIWEWLIEKRYALLIESKIFLHARSENNATTTARDNIQLYNYEINLRAEEVCKMWG